MTVAPDIDPLTLALAPPPGESPEDREARLLREREAKKRSDLIDQELARQRAADKKSSKPVKILLLGQSESGKSTTLKNFQLINSPKAFKAERPSWRAVVHLNVVRSIRLIISAIQEAEAFASAPQPPGPDDPAYPPLSADLLTLKMRLLPLQQVEEALLSKLTPGASIGKAYTAAPDDPLPGGTQEVSVHSTAPWKGAFSRLMNNVRGSVDGPETNEPQDSRDARQLLHACSEDMIHLWNDPTVKQVLKVHRLRLEDMAGFFLDSIERVTALSYEPTDDDILKARLKTLGVSEHNFNLKAGNMVPQSWIVYDVGGARSVRAAWVPYFDDMDAIIFLAPLSCFDQVLAEDETINRLEDSILLWKTIVSSPLLKDTSLILFLNKCDILKAKLESGQRFNEYVVSYGDRPNDFEHCSQYMKKKFAMIAKQYSPEARGFYTYFTSVTDVQSTADILGSVRDMLVRQNLTRSRLV
ncbi:guanine nucleotide binding protein, alpha subunit [Mycena sanguinolenta]|nr:guanine nucleotide binding protein, alpha subunit [Mycena sanguinolenta]